MNGQGEGHAWRDRSADRQAVRLAPCKRVDFGVMGEAGVAEVRRHGRRFQRGALEAVSAACESAERGEEWPETQWEPPAGDELKQDAEDERKQQTPPTTSRPRESLRSCWPTSIVRGEAALSASIDVPIDFKSGFGALVGVDAMRVGFNLE